MNIRDMQKEVHRLALAKGWWDDVSAEPAPREISSLLTNVHGEVSEANEEIRDGHAPTHVYYREEDGKPEGFGIEMADAVIRIMDTCEGLGVDLEGAIRIKHAFNKSRPHRHGGKKL